MEPVFDPFEVLSIFAEVIVGQLGFQVVAVAVGRSGVSGGSDGWHSGDTRLFFAMIGCGAFAISLTFSPIFLISELPIFTESNVDNMLYFSSMVLFFASFLALFRFLPDNWKDQDFKKNVIIFVGSFVIFNLLIQSAWLLDIYDFGIKLFYYNIIYFCIMSFFFFTSLMTHLR